MKKCLVILILGMLPVLILAGCYKNEKATVNKPASTNAIAKTFSAQGYDKVSDTLFRRKHEAAKSTNGSAPRFSIVEDSGIEFANRFSADAPDSLLETGSGVAIADYDNDGFVDVYLLSIEGRNRLFRGLGNFKFEDVTEKAGVSGASIGSDAFAAGATFADIDNDGDLDLHVCNMTSNDILYVNNGDGTFTDETDARGIKNSGASKIGNFCDYDLDGDLDLYVVTNRNSHDFRKPQTVTAGDRIYIHPDYCDIFGFVNGRIKKSGQRDYLYQNDGKGFFVDVTAKSKITDFAQGLSATWLDYNDDGSPDIYVANDSWRSDRLYENQGDGTFVDVLPKATKQSPWFSKGSDIGDIDNDGIIDLMVGDTAASNHLGKNLNMSLPEDSDWFLEFGSPRQSMSNAVYLNSGNGGFMDVANMTGLSNTDWAWSTRLADLDNDGRLDVFVTNGNARDRMNVDTIKKLERLKIQSKLSAYSDLEKNMPALPQQNLAFSNRGNLEFEDVSQKWGLDLNGISHGSAMADLDRDGDLDIVVNNFNQPATVYRNDSDEGNRLTIALRSSLGNSFGFGSKIELWHGDSHQIKLLTPVRGYLSSDEPIAHFGLGDVTKIDRLQITWPTGNTQEFTDLESGFRYLVVETESDAPTAEPAEQSGPSFTEAGSGIQVEFTHQDGKHDDFARQPLLPYLASQMGPGVSTGDVNDDGLPDVFVGNGNNRPGSLLINRGGSIFEETQGPWKQHFLQDDMGALFFDADGDGDQDLLVTSGGTEYKKGHEQLRDRLYLNQQEGVFSYAEKAIPQAATSSSTAAALDFDHDGDLDLVIGSRSIPHKYPNASPTRLLRNDAGTFVDQSAKPLTDIGIVNSILCSDFNNDGWTDLIIATEWGPVRFLKNSEGAFSDVTSELGVAQSSGFWHGLASGDFDSDGDLDYVATNVGTNTRYKADTEHPTRLYFGDFDENGRLDLIESKFEGGIELPVRSLTSSSAAMPQLRKKFQSHEDFAKASLADVYNLNKDEADFLEVNFLESAIFWNDGGSMRIEPLPRMAQTSPGFGIETLDYDCDGDLDILVANNFFGTVPEFGLMAGGMGALLTNDGTGKFSFVLSNESGVNLQDDSMGLAVDDIDFDGDLDAIVGVHSGKARTLTNQANPASWWKLVIRGPMGNPNSIGARAFVVRQDGSTQMHEIRAGGSYLSQSTGAIFLYASEQNPVNSIQIKWPTGEVADIGKSELSDVGELSIDVSDYAGDWKDESLEVLGD